MYGNPTSRGEWNEKMKRLILTLICLILLFSSVFGWWNASWEFRQPLTLSTSTLSNDVLNDHSILVKVDSTNTDFWNSVKSDGKDVRFVAANDLTELTYHIEKFDYFGQEMIAWVKVTDTFSSVSNTNIFMYYGNPNAFGNENEAGTYPAYYKAVYNFNENSGTILDKTSNNNDSILQEINAYQVNGKMNGAVQTIASSNHATVPDSNSLDLGSNGSISFWINFGSDFPSGHSSDIYLIEKDGPPLSSNILIFQKSNGKLGFLLGNAYDYSSKSLWTGGTWHNIILTWDGVSKKAYVNASINDGFDVASGDSWKTNLADLTIFNNSNKNRSGSADHDEIRFYNIALNSDEVSLLYKSENNSLISFGNQESSGGSAPPSGDQNIWVTFVSDSGSTTVDVPEDTLTVAGGDGISTSISGDTLTITNTALSAGVAGIFAGLGIDLNANTGDVLVSVSNIVALLSGRAGGQHLYGGINAGENLTLESTANASKGLINLLDNTRIGCNGDANSASLVTCGELKSESDTGGLTVSPNAAGAGNPGIFSYLGNSLHFGANNSTSGLVLNADNDVGIGGIGAFADAKLHVVEDSVNKLVLKAVKNVANSFVPVVQMSQSNSNGNTEVLELVQNDSDEPFVEFVGSKGNAASIDTNIDKRLAYMLKTTIESNSIEESVYLPVYGDGHEDPDNVIESEVSQSSGFSTNSLVFVDVTNPAGFDLNIPKKSTVILNAMVTHFNNVGGTNNFFRWKLGNNESVSVAQETIPQFNQVTTTYVQAIFKNIEPGIYNAKLQMKVSGGTGIIAFSTNDSVAQLTAVTYEE